MSSIRPAIIIVPGAWHRPFHYQRLEVCLKRAGYTTYTVDLPSVGSKVPLKEITPDVQAVRKAIEAQLAEGLNVMVLMHSYGGMPGTCACKGLRPEDRSQGNGVIGLMFAAAFLTDEGISMLDVSHGYGPWAKPLGPMGTGVYLSCEAEGHDPRNVFYNDCSPELAEEAYEKLESMSESVCHDPCTYAAWKEINSHYLICTLDQAMPVEVQTSLSSREGGKWKIVEKLEAGHSPFLSRPEETASWVRRCAGEDV